MVQMMGESIDLLPHFSRLEVLEAANMLLPSYHNDSLLLYIQTVRRLYLKTVSIQWMAGCVFPLLEACTIISHPVPFWQPMSIIFQLAESHFHHRCILSFHRFQLSIVSSLRINRNH